MPLHNKWGDSTDRERVSRFFNDIGGVPGSGLECDLEPSRAALRVDAAP